MRTWRRSTNKRPCDTSFPHIFLIEIDFNYSQVPQGHVQHPGGRRQRGHGVVHHVPLKLFSGPCDISILNSF